MNSGMSQSALRKLIEDYKSKFESAKIVRIVRHKPIHAGEALEIDKEFEITAIQRDKITLLFDELLLLKKYTYREPMPMVRPYDVTIVLQYPGTSELITITCDREEITAHGSNPYPVPLELPQKVFELINSF
jgi:hypothetical protein